MPSARTWVIVALVLSTGYAFPTNRRRSSTVTAVYTASPIDSSELSNPVPYPKDPSVCSCWAWCASLQPFNPDFPPPDCKQICGNRCFMESIAQHYEREEEAIASSDESGSGVNNGKRQVSSELEVDSPAGPIGRRYDRIWKSTEPDGTKSGGINVGEIGGVVVGIGGAYRPPPDPPRTLPPPPPPPMPPAPAGGWAIGGGRPLPKVPEQEE